jgi:DNA-binding transcriptional MerR regulator
MARLNHIPAQTLRFYDKIGLIKPDAVDEVTGYRHYRINQSAWLDMIQYMKSLGMSLEEIKKQLELRSPSLIEQILTQKSQQIDRQMADLTQQKRAIARSLQSYRHYQAAPPDGTIVLEYIPQRLIYRIDTGINFYTYGIEVYERMLRTLKERMLSDHLPPQYFCNAGTILRKEHLCQRNFTSSEMFVFVDQEYVDPNLTETIAPHSYLCIYCDRFEKEKEYINRLLDAIDQQGYVIAGDYLCEVIAEFPLLERNKRGMFLRLQIPVEFAKHSR